MDGCPLGLGLVVEDKPTEFSCTCTHNLQRDGKPYCHNPCYSALFGPKGFGRGGTESHDYN